ncbi:uncharacterized protein H6S33_005671 [Morchella sextelata]|uniref:uncharacterized protein n=1 Tax=Morchella sextelata TaxID=1174677 RepID=UPI001D0517DC|nr:uncharacterized protein H6S33_005671 [Morchella sextelata]KAH0613785.1 hypothetical protein H6S33_005671 [Morchella sextelata]
MGGGFSESCKNIELVNGHILRAECRNDQGHHQTSELDLNTCIGNLNGYLAWDTPNFSQTSQNIRLVENGTKIEATLLQISGHHSAPQGIYLNQRIVNRNGCLRFIPHNEL